ncbi:MAG: FAD-dependent oxidoreductase, partial [Bradymonadaceae bacterium]
MTLTSVERYPHQTVPAVGHHAVVVGGSIAGLLAARVLSDAFEQVTVVEKDTYPERPKPRRGVPQGAQIHALQEAGRATLEDLFPGFGEDLLSAGGLLLDATSDLKYYMAGGFLADGTERMPGYSATRPLIEHVIRRRIAERPDIRLRTGCRVTEYLTEGDAATVTGVSLGDD